MHLNLSGYITDTTSYGLVTLNLLKSMTDLGVEISVHCTQPRQEYGKYTSYVRKSESNALSFDHNAPSLRIAHQFDMAPSIGSGSRIGYTFFEVNQLTKLEQHHLKSLDCVIVPTQWAKDVCSKYNIDADICPAGYDPEVFYPVDYIRPSCAFLTVGKWEVRKQQDQIVRAFQKAFSPKDNTELWVSCDNKFIPNTVEERKRSYKDALGDKIKLIGRVSSDKDLARIMQQSYCFVAPSLAEGWNLPLLEAMACGKYNIATRHSGHTEFCDEYSTLFIEPTGLQPAVDNMWFKENSPTNCGEWCTYKEDDLIDRMREVYYKYKDGINLNGKAHEQARKFTWENSAEQMKRCIQYCQFSVITQRNQNMGLYDNIS